MGTDPADPLSVPPHCTGGVTSTTTTTTTLPCTAVTDPRAAVKVTARRDTGKLSAKMSIDLAGYDGEQVTVSLSDTDTPLIAQQDVGPLPAIGSSGKKWQFKTRSDGVQKIALTNLAPHETGVFKLSVKTKHFFTAADANQSAANTLLTVQIGNNCFTHAATKKTD